MKIAIVGFGNFGQFLAKTFVKQGHVVLGQSRSDYTSEAKAIGANYVASTDELMAQDPEVVIFCTSIMSTKSVLQKFPMHTLSNRLVVDVLSVKLYPKELLLDMCPKDADIVCTHPMFGPESGKASWQNLPFVYEIVRASNEKRADDFIDIWKNEGCKMVLMSCEQHDAYAASTQFVTHLTGRILGNLNVQSTPINTKGYEQLLGVVDTTCKDSFDLFYGLYKYNPNSLKELDKMEESLKAIRKQLDSYGNEKH